MKVTVIFGEDDVEQARRVGLARQAFHDARGTKDAYGLVTSNPAKHHVQGALAEWLIARLLGREEEWIEVTADYKALRGDVGGVQVRSGGERAWGLLLHPRDPDDCPFVGVRFHGHGTRRADILGWIMGEAGKREQWWMGEWQRPCYSVPWQALNPWDAATVIEAEPGER